MKKIVIIGYGGHGRVIADSILNISEYELVGYTDEIKKQDTNIPYLGTDDILDELYKSGVEYAAVGIGYLGNGITREKIYDVCKKIGFKLPVIIDSSAIIANDVIIDEGTYVGKRAVLNAGTKIGKMCIINTAAIVEHESDVRDYAHISVNTTLCGNVCIGEGCMIGAGAVITQGRKIGKRTIVGASTMVNRDVEENKKVVGVPFRYI